jgi:glycolate oxidase
MDDLARQIASICEAYDAMEVRIAQDEDERAALWRGRQGSFGSITRLAPNYMSLDGAVPRTMLPEALRRVRELAAGYGLEVFCTLHAGDGNLHPCFLYDGKEPGAKEKVEEASMGVLRICATLGGTVSGENGIGVEKLEAMHYVFGENDLRVQRLLKDAFDPENLCNPGKVLPAEER